MKRICSLIVALLLIIPIVGCGSKKAFPDNITCEDIMKAAQSVGEVPEAEKIYLSRENNLSATSLALWADGLYEECKDFGIIEDYAIFLCAGTDTYEIAVLRAKDKQDADAMFELFERRKSTLKLGDKGAYDPKFEKRMEDSVLSLDGEFFIFLITDNNDEALKAIESLKQ